MTRLKDLVDLDSPIKYELYNGHRLKMVGHDSPLSISDVEFDFLQNFIARNNIKSCYEIATGFGVSTLAMGLGLKETGGRLVTLDAYIEEKENSGYAYETYSNEKYERSDGFVSVNYLIKKFSLENNVFPFVGWSPDDTPEAIKAIFGDTPLLDCVFIDGGHFDDFAIRDLDSIIPYLANEWTIFFHDRHMLGETFKNHLINKIGKDTTLVPGCHFPQGYFLSYITNNEGIKL